MIWRKYTESGLKLLGLDLASLATQGVGAGAQPNAYTGYAILLLGRQTSHPLQNCRKSLDFPPDGLEL